MLHHAALDVVFRDQVIQHQQEDCTPDSLTAILIVDVVKAGHASILILRLLWDTVNIGAKLQVFLDEGCELFEVLAGMHNVCVPFIIGLVDIDSFRVEPVSSGKSSFFLLVAPEVVIETNVVKSVLALPIAWVDVGTQLKESLECLDCA